MAEHAWTVICDRVIVDQETNNISLDVVEQVQIFRNRDISLPADVPVPLRVVSLWYQDGADTSASAARLRVMGPDGEELGSSSFDVSLTQARVRTITSVPILRIVGPGVYHFVVDLELEGAWKMVARVPLEIDLPVGASAP